MQSASLTNQLLAQPLFLVGLGLMLYSIWGLKNPALSKQQKLRRMRPFMLAAALFMIGVFLTIPNIAPIWFLYLYVIWCLLTIPYLEFFARRLPKDPGVDPEAARRSANRDRRTKFIVQLIFSSLAFGLVGAGIGTMFWFYASAQGLASWMWPLAFGIITFGCTCFYFARRFGPKQW